MKRTLRAILAFVFLFALVSTALAGAQDFILVNRTGYDIYTVNISPTSTSDWEEDVLGSTVLENGDNVVVRFVAEDAAFWDIQAIFEDGSSISWYKINLLETAVVTLNGDGTADLE